MISPTVSDFQFEIGSRMGRGDLAGAAAVAARCRELWPQDPAGWLLGSIAALLADETELALNLVEKRLAIDSGNLQCLLQKAECLLASGERSLALAAAEAAAAQADGSVMALDSIGEFLFHAGAYAEALGIYHLAVRSAPADSTILAKRADIHRVLGQFDLATLDYESVLKLSPGAPKALKGLVELRRQSLQGNSLANMETALASAAAGSTDASILHFGLAKSYEDLGDPVRSWKHLTDGNRLERARLDYSPEQDRELVQRIVESFPDIETPRPDTTGERPIFIVGIPRTGSTLIDRIISGHSSVETLGESSALPEAIERAAGASENHRGPHRAAPAELDAHLIASGYLARCRAQRGTKPRFTDKLLTNFFHCALIVRAFPGAHIVHVSRHPLATCHAIYRTRFNGTYPFAYDLMEIGAFYVGYRRLMAHWHQVLPGRIVDVNYEDVVTALEPTTRLLCQRLDLPFEPHCLAFHRNPAPVKTTSSVQVRQPLYDSSVHLWREYSTELAPLRSLLEDSGIPIE